jgi:hypothetical protein
MSHQDVVRHEFDEMDADEAKVGLITKSTSAIHPRPVFSRSLLAVILLVSNVAWAGTCFILWRESRTSLPVYTADFGKPALLTVDAD